MKRATAITLGALCLLGAYGAGRASFPDPPHCQEDEVLYPSNYEGPGDNAWADYQCRHIDTFHTP